MTIYMLCGMSWGDEGKGTITDFICRKKEASLVVRYNGGAQAGHRVALRDGRSHIFSQFGSGTLAGAATHLSRFMMVNPITFLTEEKFLEEDCGVKNALVRVTVEARALVTTPFHISANRIKEAARNDGRHGSCGMGIGETMSDFVTYGYSEDVVIAGDLRDQAGLAKQLRRIQERKYAEVKGLHTEPGRVEADWAMLMEPDAVETAMARYRVFKEKVGRIVDDRWLASYLATRPTDNVVFEGAQGVLLDEWWGFHPNTTWSTCTWKNAKDVVPAEWLGEVECWGILRAFTTRHGAGPFPTESMARGFVEAVHKDHNHFNEWQRHFRAGAFDLVLARYAKEVLGRLDGLCITHLDTLEEMPAPGRICIGYDRAEEPFFERRGDTAFRIRMGSFHDLARQEAIGKALGRVQPVYDTVTTQSEYLAPLISGLLGAPLRVLSHGPTEADKVLVR